MTFTTRAVNGLATRDYGGSGGALLLMHGAGMDQSSLEPVTSRLPFRVITFDFRGHGASTTTDPWTLAQAVEDVGAVAAAYQLEAPALGGHSLGGMVALLYGIDHPVAGVINIDGHGRGRPDQYPGYTESEVRSAWERQDQRLEQLMSGARAVLLKGLLLALRRAPIAADTALQVTREAGTIDLPALYSRLTCPLLVFNAVAEEPSRLMRRWAGEGLLLARSYREGLTRDLAALAVERPATEVVTVDAPHVLIRTHPDLVADRMTAFLQRTFA